MNNLLPCPFCGGKAFRDHNEGYQWRITCCSECGASTSEVGVFTQDEADAKWNRRSPQISEATMRNYPLFDGTKTVHEDELPGDMTNEDYAAWYPLSRVDFVRVGPKPIGPPVQISEVPK